MSNLKERYANLEKNLYLSYEQLLDLNEEATDTVSKSQNCTPSAEVIDKLCEIEGVVKNIDKEIKVMKGQLAMNICKKAKEDK